MSSNVKKSRKLILDKFKKKKIDYLVCTDALARGIDIGIIDNVISYDSPRFIKTYIHRVGRTARAGKPGTAYTLIHEDSEKESFKEILEGANKDFDSVVEYKIDEENLDMDNYELIRSQASKFLHDEKNSKRKKGRRGKNVKNPIKKDKMIDNIIYE
ncbi:DDX51 [Lepeophtheirus salmonis]|uniref:DDX51 n=1 Tax=Lepeophtheirus salmonis TaxID=72036 RepID=A0A7R8CC39_LEPSM|nr:DDX51 [Lepeophtheirus salmonis]CAF2766938.1 DDX51 [Lepeophtheirus salmonis]